MKAERTVATVTTNHGVIHGGAAFGYATHPGTTARINRVRALKSPSGIEQHADRSVVDGLDAHVFAKRAALNV